MKKHEVELTSEERQTLETLVSKGEHNALENQTRSHLAEGRCQGSCLDEMPQIAEAFGCHEQTVYNVRKRFRERGGLAALRRKKQSRPSRLPKLDGQGEARLIALCCSDPPEGFSRWTLQRLADKLVELQVVESLSAEGVRQILKKNALRPHRQRAWVIPPDEDEAFVAAMETVLYPINPICSARSLCLAMLT